MGCELFRTLMQKNRVNTDGSYLVLGSLLKQESTELKIEGQVTVTMSFVLNYLLNVF